MQHKKLIQSIILGSTMACFSSLLINTAFANNASITPVQQMQKKHRHKKIHHKKVKEHQDSHLLAANNKIVNMQPEKNITPGKIDVPDSSFEEALKKHLTANAVLTSNYVYRGISQTKNRPALQGSATYTLDNGLYGSIWGSTVKFSDTGTPVVDEETQIETRRADQDPLSRAYLELDAILGYGHEFNENLKIDLNVARYLYPSARELNYNQFNSLLTYHFLELGYQYSANANASHTRSAYYLLGINYDLPEKFIKTDHVNLHLTTAYSDMNIASGYGSYHDYSAMISKKFKMLTLGLQWTTTDGRAKQNNLDDTQWIASATVDLV